MAAVAVGLCVLASRSRILAGCRRRLRSSRSAVSRGRGRPAWSRPIVWASAVGVAVDHRPSRSPRGDRRLGHAERPGAGRVGRRPRACVALDHHEDERVARRRARAPRSSRASPERKQLAAFIRLSVRSLVAAWAPSPNGFISAKPRAWLGQLEIAAHVAAHEGRRSPSSVCRMSLSKLVVARCDRAPSPRVAPSRRSIHRRSPKARQAAFAGPRHAKGARAGAFRRYAGLAAGAYSAVSSGGFFAAMRGRAGRLDLQHDLVVLHHDLHDAALGELAEQQLLGQRLLDVLLDHPAERARAHLVVVALVGQPLGRLGRQLDLDVAVHQLRLELQHELLDHLQDHLLRQRREADHRVEPVAELRREHPLDRRRVLALAPRPAEAERVRRLLLRARRSRS